MTRLPSTLVLGGLLFLSGCGAGETAATTAKIATLQAEQASQAQQQIAQLKLQIEQANTINTERLRQDLQDNP